jgi:hypothetical protein
MDSSNRLSSARERLVLDALESEVFVAFRAAYVESARQQWRELGDLSDRVLWWRAAARRLSSRAWDRQGILMSALAVCAAEVAREFEVAFFLLVHGCYRQVGVLLRSALELLVTGYYLDANPVARRAWTVAYRPREAPSPLQFGVMVQALSAAGGFLAGWRVPASLGGYAVRPGVYVSVVLKRLYGVLTQFVHAKPETLDCVRALEESGYQRDRFYQLARMLVDVMAVGSLLLQGRVTAI